MKIKKVLLLPLMVGSIVLLTSCQNSQQNPIVENDRDEHGCISSAGYSRCETKTKCIRTREEDCIEEQKNVQSEWWDTDEETKKIQAILDIVESIKTTTNINFKTPSPTTFDRIIERSNGIDRAQIDGYLSRAKNLEQTSFDIEEFFKKQGRTMDIYNMADGTVASLVWYQKDDLVCTIYQEVSGRDEGQGEIPETFEDQTFNIKLQCGYTE